MTICCNHFYVYIDINHHFYIFDHFLEEDSREKLGFIFICEFKEDI